MSDISKFSRRGFLKKLGVAATLPVLTRAATGQETTGTESHVDAPEGHRHRIVTANILASLSEHDNTPIDWETQRKDVCITVLKNQQADIICMQEVLRSQFKDFQEGFPGFENFGYEGPYMDTAPKRFQGVKNVIMYSRERYELTSAGTYWFSDTPLIEGSRSYGEKLGRHANWVRLRDKESRKEFRVINTHFAVRNRPHQEASAKMINDEAGQYLPDFPQLLTGDFNATDSTNTIRMIKDAGWKDTYEAVHGDDDAGWSFHGFEKEERDRNAKDVQIDWIFCRGIVKPVAAKVIRENVNGLYPSDHMFVSADVII